MSRSQKHIKHKKSMLIVAGTLLLIAGSATAWMYYTNNSPSTTSKTTQEGIDSSPATADEQKAADEQKTTFANKQNQQKDTGNTSNDGAITSPILKPASVYITYAQQNGDIIDVNAYTNQYENGTCTMVFTKGSANVSKKTSAYTDASTTICNNPRIPRSEFSSSGEWLVTVIYTSSTSSGASKSQAVTIN